MKKEEEIIVVDRCSVCGKQWDEDGCRVSDGPNPSEVRLFVCKNCEE